MEIDGANNSGRLKKSWWDWTVKDMKCLGPSQHNVQSRNNISLDWHLPRWTWVSRTRLAPFWILLELIMTKVVVTCEGMARVKIWVHNDVRANGVVKYL